MSTHGGLPRNQLLIGDALAQLAELPAASVDCVITSPPYFALRDYGTAGQLGLENTVAEWVTNLRAVCRELARVLKSTGGFWLNVSDSYSHHPKEGAPKKSLLLGPQRLALALVADGWLLRNHVVWAKTNPMPSNVTDRLSNTHESVYFFTRAQRYYFDLNAIREPHKDERVHAGRKRTQDNVYPPRGVLPRRDARAGDVNGGLVKLKGAGLVGHPLGKNPGDVWAMGTAAFHGEHFATFPAKLVERPLRATCPERVCATCGQPWQRAKQQIQGRLLAVGKLKPDCTCRADWRPGVVLDPFMGTGTVALVAEQHGRDWVGIELNPRYVAMAEQRLRAWREQQNKFKEEQGEQDHGTRK
jgi:site-specific DNA-methyltransferase (adenine-specific)